MNSGPTTWKARRLDAAGLGVLVVLTLFAYVGGYLPLAESRQGFLAGQAELAKQRDQADRLEATLIARQKRWDQGSKSLAEGAIQLKPDTSLNQQLTLISGLALENGLRIDDVRIGNAVAETHCEVIPVVLAGTGTYRACTVFLHRLRETLPDTNVASFALTAEAGKASGAAKFRFSLRWHAAPKLETALK